MGARQLRAGAQRCWARRGDDVMCQMPPGHLGWHIAHVDGGWVNWPDHADQGFGQVVDVDLDGYEPGGAA